MKLRMRFTSNKKYLETLKGGRYTMNEKKVGPDIHTHQAGAKDLNKTIVRKKQVIEPVEQGPGIYDDRNRDKKGH